MDKWFDGLGKARFFGLRSDRNDNGRNNPQWHETEDDRMIVLSYSRPRQPITPRGFACLVAAFLVFKATVIVYFGPDTYGAAIYPLEYGTLAERAAAFIMWPDAVSQFIAAGFGVLTG